MKAMRKAIVFIIIIILIVLFRTFQGVNLMHHKIDPSIIEIINKLECPSERHNISETVFKSSDIIQNSRLSFVASWEENGSIIELYKGEYNGYLAVLVSEDKIYCAQYVNDFYTDSIDFDHIDDYEFYFYEMEAVGDGIYCKTRVAYFLDGRELSQVYYYPQESSPTLQSITSTSSLLPQM